MAENWLILRPDAAPQAYEIAAAEFQKFYGAVTGKRIEITTQPNGPANLVVIGAGQVNPFARVAVEQKIIPPFALGGEGDDYCLRSAVRDGRRFLFLAGGSGRATLYAVYDFFERRAGCRYFWDGDIIPKQTEIEMDGLDVRESPRFTYRGTRYFAHRSLDRFQAEHWGPVQWEQEIDWLLKKRLNLFMLRIGMDDVFQKAFPEVVSYPPDDGPLPEAVPRSFDDRTSAWGLKYRGELRKHILTYAAARGLIHPEDTGTMTHWYSRTPIAFLEKIKPSFMPQSGGAYLGNPTGAVWDIREDRNLDNYWKLTAAHIKYYGSPEMFHTIGLAERDVFPDRAENMQMKCYAYRRIIGKLREHYPRAPILIAAWDFYQPGWSGVEVASLLKILDPTHAIILDYTADLPESPGSSDFRSWDVIGKFPWIFGIFHAYEWENELRGNYDQIARNLPIAAADPLCKGMVYWPENSHSDILMLEFFSKNAWKPGTLTPEALLPEFCRNRYPAAAGPMLEIWQAAMPLIRLQRELCALFANIQTFPCWDIDPVTIGAVRDECRARAATIKAVPHIFRMLARLPFGQGDDFIDRDAIDLARTVAGRTFTHAIHRYRLTQEGWVRGNATPAEVAAAGQQARAVLTGLRDLLALHEDYSMNASLGRLQAIHPVNPAFEQALKGNAENWYCRAYIYELFAYRFIPAMDMYTDWVDAHIARGDRNVPMKTDTPPSIEAVVDAFYARPLAEMAPPVMTNPRELYRQVLGELAATAEGLDFGG